MTAPSALDRALGQGTTQFALIGAIGIMAVALAILVDVLMRWLFQTPIVVVDDVGKLVIAVVIASFLPAGLAHGQFVTIRFLGRALGPKPQQWLEVVGAVATLVVFALLAWQMTLYAVETTRSGLATQVIEAPVAPWWWMTAAVLIASVAIQAYLMVAHLAAAISGRPRPVAGGDHESGTFD